MKKGRKLAMILGIIGIFLLVILPMVCAIAIYEMNFGVRYETSQWCGYTLEDFQGLQRDKYTFESYKGDRLQGYHYYEDKSSTPKGLVVLAHGFGGGGHTSYMPEINALVEGRYEVFTYDATANDASEGRGVRGMPQGVLDLDQALSFVEGQEQFKGLPILLYGHSWGGYSVMTVLNKEHNIAGGIAMAGFNKSLDMILEQGSRIMGEGIKVFKPYIGLYERLKFGKDSDLTSLGGLEKTDSPMLLIHSKDDSMVSFDNHYSIFKAALTNKKNIQFMDLDLRGHECLRTEETQKELEGLRNGYQALKKSYGSKEAIPEEKLNFIYEENKRLYAGLDQDLMKQMIAFYDSAVGYKESAKSEEVNKEEVTEAEKQVETMTLEEKVGQMLLARCPDVGAVESIKNYHLGGYVLFKRDFEGKQEEEVKATLRSYQEVAQIPMVLAVDEEGGSVVRISSNPNLVEHPYLSPQALYKAGGLGRVEEDAIEKSKYLKALGITMNLAPVADISQNPTDYIYPRTIGMDGLETAEYVRKVVANTQQEGISSTLKHFPGYGGNVDTHTGLAYDKRPYEQFLEEDYLPFQAGIEAGVHSILVSHNIVEAIDKEYPASLSSKVHEELRNTLGFEGIILTDDLEMEAIKTFTHGLHPAVQAVLAGNDMLIVTNFQEAHQEIMNAVKDGIIPEETINTAVRRILAWKYL